MQQIILLWSILLYTSAYKTWSSKYLRSAFKLRQPIKSAHNDIAVIKDIRNVHLSKYRNIGICAHIGNFIKTINFTV